MNNAELIRKLNSVGKAIFVNEVDQLVTQGASEQSPENVRQACSRPPREDRGQANELAMKSLAQQFGVNQTKH